MQTFSLPLTPWELYQKIYPASPVSFFLDSIQYQFPNQEYSYLGWDPFLTCAVSGDRLRVSGREKGNYPVRESDAVLRRLLKKYKPRVKINAPYFTGGAVGFWGYEMARYYDRIRFRAKKQTGTPDLFLGFYKKIIVYDHRRKKYYATPEALKNFPHICCSAPLPAFQTAKFKPEIKKNRFEAMVRQAKKYIEAGDIYQANLSQKFTFDYKGSTLKLYGALRRINPSPFASFLKCGPTEIISSSPERLIRKQGSHCETRPIAGTRGRKPGRENVADLKKELLRHPKERAEHIMLVDLERNDLGRVCDFKTVRVEEMMGIEKYSHVIHIVSKITGRLAKEKDGFDLIRAMFPGGTITGCPKIRCMEIIDELEPSRRGIYTGSVGYVDFKGDLDLNIVIRTFVLHKGKGVFQVGAGIVHDSDPAKEYEETLHKGEALAQALAEAGS